MYNLILPGQGSQSVGMVDDLFKEHTDVASEIFAIASQAIGVDLKDISRAGDKINETQFTQPLLLTASYAVWQIISSRVEIASLGGHSLGEYSALAVSDAINFDDAVRLVHKRGQLMSKATGVMAAVLGLADDKVESICAELSVGNDYISGANYNVDGQLVIAGKEATLAKAEEKLKAAGAKRVIKLAVSIPSHCALMSDAAAEFADHLSGINVSMPKYRFFSNFTSKEVLSIDELRSNLINQMTKPVLWKFQVKNMSLLSKNFLELGSSVLSDMMKKIDDTILATSLNSAEKIVNFCGK